MIRRLIPVLLGTAMAMAQQASPPAAPPTGKSASLPPVPQVSADVNQRLIPVSHSDLYCSGFIGKPVTSANHVLGELNSPNATRYHQGNFIFLRGQLQPGTRVSFLRSVRDPNRFQAYEGQRRELKRLGETYSELGYAVIVEQRGKNTSVAKIEFSCEAVLPGDLVVPFVEKPAVTFRERVLFDRFPSNPSTVGRIVLARDFDQYVATGQKVYLDVGGNKGLKVGDNLLVVRSYRPDELDAADRAALNATILEDSGTSKVRISKRDLDDLPERVVGGAIVVGVQEQSATAMVTFALSEIHVGDRVSPESAAPPAQARGSE